MGALQGAPQLALWASALIGPPVRAFVVPPHRDGGGLPGKGSRPCSLAPAVLMRPSVCNSSREDSYRRSASKSSSRNRRVSRPP